MLKRLAQGIGFALLLALLYLATLWFNLYGEHQPPGEVHPNPLPHALRTDKASAQAETVATAAPAHAPPAKSRSYSAIFTCIALCRVMPSS
jgi:hypothetical protein